MHRRIDAAAPCATTGDTWNPPHEGCCANDGRVPPRCRAEDLVTQTTMQEGVWRRLYPQQRRHHILLGLLRRAGIESYRNDRQVGCRHHDRPGVSCGNVLAGMTRAAVFSGVRPASRIVARRRASITSLRDARRTSVGKRDGLTQQHHPRGERGQTSLCRPGQSHEQDDSRPRARAASRVAWPVKRVGCYWRRDSSGMHGQNVLEARGVGGRQFRPAHRPVGARNRSSHS